MKKYIKIFFLTALVFITVISLFAFSGCKKKNVIEDSESAGIVVTEEIFNKNVKSPVGGISRFSVKALSEYDEKYLVEGQRYYLLAVLKDTETHKMTVTFSGASAIEDQIFIMSRDGSDHLEVTKEKNSYTGALDGIAVNNTAFNKKSDYYVAVGFSLYEGFGEEINVKVDSYINVGGSDNWDDGVSCQKQSAHQKHVKTQSSIKFLSETDYKSGDIDAKLKDTLTMTVGEKYYAVIDYKLYEPVGITETDRASIRVNVKGANAVWANGVLVSNRFTFDIEEFPTAEYNKDSTGIDASFFFTFNAEGVAEYRFIVSINPLDAVKVSVDAKLSGNKISFVLDGKPEGSISTGDGEVVRSLEYLLSADQSYYTVVGLGNENRDRINIPATYNGLPVKEIAAETFNGVKYLKEVKIPFGVEKIGKNAFAGCDGLKFIVIPSSVTVISLNAFDDCDLNIFYEGTVAPSGWHAGFNPENLTVFTDCKKSRGTFRFILNSDGLSYTVTGGNCNAERIVIPAVYGDYPVTHVASGLYNFIGITLPESVVSVEDGALKNTDDLTYACIPASARAYIKTDRLKWLEIKGKTVPSEAFKGCTDLTSVILSNSVTEIGDGAFYGCSELLSVTLGSSTQSIGDSAFYGCKKLSALSLPDSVTAIGEYAFSGCAALPRITLGNNVTSLGKYAFEYCSSVNEISLGTGITTIPEGAFRHVTSLNFYTIPDHIVTIEKYAFYGCRGLVSVTVGDSLETVGEEAFYNCTSLVEIIQDRPFATSNSVENGYIGYYALRTPEDSFIENVNGFLFFNYSNYFYLVKYTGEGGDITLPDYGGKSYEVYQYAFYDNDTITGLTVSGKVTYLGSDSFYDCDRIFRAEISGEVDYVMSYAFYSCDGLTHVTIGNSVTGISKAAFEACESLTTVKLGNGVETVGERAFYNCHNLMQVKFGSTLLEASVSYISISAFEGCVKLSGVIELPGDMLVIRERAFAGCTGITEIKLGSLVWDIGEEAFDGCTSLENITVSEYNTDYKSEDGVLYYIKDGKTLVKYPEGKKQTGFTVPSDVLTIGAGAFYGAKNLESIT